jgi:outer membrane protein assembly factor BamD
LVLRAKARLREAQEVLAQGEFETANFYEMRGAYRAARGRFKEIIEHYPNFSEGDQVLFGMAQTLEHLKTPKEAAPYYSRLVRDFPLSPRVDEAKGRLVALGQPIPKPTKATLARAEADAARLRSKSLLEKLAIAMAGTPDTSTTLRGPVELGGGQASGIELAKRVPTTTIPNASIIAQPVGDSNLTSEKAEEIKPATDSSPKATSAEATENRPAISANEGSLKAPGNNANLSGNPSGPKAQESQASSSNSNQTSAKAEDSNAKSAAEDQSGNNTPPKKKSRFHIFKKIIKPI